MKSSWTLLSSFALSALASPVPEDLLRYLTPRDVTATQVQMTDFGFYAQYAASGYCNYDVANGTVVTCADDVCPDVTDAGTVVTNTFESSITNVAGYVGRDDTNKLIVVALRGSNSIRNWITDFVFVQTSCDIVDDCYIHVGFQTAYQEIKDILRNSVTAAKQANPDYNIVITGHSLGAAVASIAGAYLRKETGFSVDTYTFASPRVGNKAFVEYVTNQAPAQGNNYRITHVNDIVPRLPPIFLGFRHISPEYWLSTGDAYTIQYAASDVLVCDGYANTSCNAGTSGLTPEAHLHYLINITDCAVSDHQWKRDAADLSANASTLTDEQLAVILEEYHVKDMNATAHMSSAWE